MPLYIKDNETTSLVADLADRMKTTKQNAVKTAVRAELDRLSDQPSVDAQLEAFYARHPTPLPTGQLADKAFFDELSGEFD